jgi:hypothetical protein
MVDKAADVSVERELESKLHIRDQEKVRRRLSGPHATSVLL